MSHIDNDPVSDQANEAWAEALVLLKQGSYASALGRFIHLAQQDYSRAAYAAATIFAQGPGDVPQDLANAEYWFERAARERNDIDARYDLARIILLRCGSAQDPGSLRRANLALGILEELVAQGSPRAAILLGAMYLEGDVVSPDLNRAETLFRQAAGAGFVFPLVQLSAIERRRGHIFRAIFFRMASILKGVPIACRDPNDERLLFVNPGWTPQEECLPGWIKNLDGQ